MQKQVLDAITSGKIQATNIILGDNIKEQHNVRIDKVEAGGIGLQMAYKEGELVSSTSSSPSVSSEPTPEPAPVPDHLQEVELTDGTLDQHLQLFKDAMLKVQDVKYSEIKFATAIMKQYEWYAVMRLGQDIGLIDGYTDLITLMEEGDFKHKPNNPQSVNPYKKHINPNSVYPNWQCTERASEPFFRKFKFIADNTYCLYKLGCKQHHIRPFGSDK